MEEQQKITFETVYEILKEEKRKEEVLKLEPDFFIEISKYIKEKQNSIISTDEMSQKQFLNFKRMVTEHFERRAAKIIRLSMLSSQLKTIFVDKSKFLPFELELFNTVANVLKEKREKILEEVLKANLEPTKSESEEISKKAKEEYEKNSIIEEEKSKDLKNEEISLDKEHIKISFTKEVSKFVGENMEIFGPYAKDDIATLPKKIANILVKRETAIILEDE